jgi:hypothetical protein
MASLEGNCGFVLEAGKIYPFRVWFGSEDGAHPQAKGLCRVAGGRKLPDAALCNAVQEMDNGLIDADLGGFLYKKRGEGAAVGPLIGGAL